MKNFAQEFLWRKIYSLYYIILVTQNKLRAAIILDYFLKYFEIMVDSHAIAGNNTPRSCVILTYFLSVVTPCITSVHYHNQGVVNDSMY